MGRKGKVVPGNGLSVPRSESSSSGMQTKYENFAVNRIISLKLIVTLFTFAAIVVTGAVFLSTSMVMNVRYVRDSIKHEQMEVALVMKKTIEEYLRAPVLAADFIQETERRLSNAGGYSLHRSSGNPNVNVFSDTHEVIETIATYAVTSGVMCGRYIESDLNGVLAMVEGGERVYGSLNSDQSLYILYSGNSAVINDSDYEMLVPPTKYDVFGKEWFADAYNSGNESWSIYFQAALNQAISYSRPITFPNGTIKAVVNACFMCDITREYIEERRGDSRAEILITEGNGDMIVTTLDGVNVSELVYNEAKARYEGRKVNAADSTGVVREAYERFSSGDESATIRGEYYAQFVTPNVFGDDHWMVAVLIDKGKVDAPYISGLISNSAIMVGMIVMTVIAANVVIYSIAFCFFRPLDKVIQKVNSFEACIDFPRLIIAELRGAYNSLRKLISILRRIRSWLPRELVLAIAEDREPDRIAVKASSVFVDLVEYTRRSANAGTDAAVEMLNKFFTSVGEVAGKNPSIEWDKTIGDAVLLYCYQSGHRAIVGDFIQHMLAECAEKFRIGASCGPVTVAAVGDSGGGGRSGRVQYTLIGNSVNESSRLQELCKEYGGLRVLISEDMWSGLGDGRECKWVFVDIANIRGLDRARAVFTTIDVKDDSMVAEAKHMNRWHAKLLSGSIKEFLADFSKTSCSVEDERFAKFVSKAMRLSNRTPDKDSIIAKYVSDCDIKNE